MKGPKLQLQQQSLTVKFVQSQDADPQASVDFLRWLIKEALAARLESEKTAGKEAA